MPKFLKKFFEAGKRNSSVDAARIQESHDHMVSLGATCQEATPAKATEALRLAETLRVDDSFESRKDALRVAAQLLLANTTDTYSSYPYVYVRDCFNTDVIVQCGNGIYQIPYTVGTDGDDVTLGTPVPVDVAYIPADGSEDETETAGDEIVEGQPLTTKSKKRKHATEMDSEKITEAAKPEQNLGSFVELREGAVGTDGAAQIKIIQPGWGSSGYYPKEVLKRDGPKVFRKGLKMFWNHQTKAEESERPEGDLSDLAAELTGDAAWNEQGPAGAALYAPIGVFEQYQAPVNDLSKSIGVSIRAAGMAAKGKAEGQEGPIIQSLESARSIDFVTSPGAGGEIVQLFEAARVRKPNQESEMEIKNLQEANTLLTAQAAQLNEQKAQIAKLNEGMLIGQASTFVSDTLASVQLPAVTKTRLASELINAMPLKEGALDKAVYKTRIDEAVAAATAEIAAITGAGQVKGMGATPTADETASLAESEKVLNESLRTLGLSEAGAKLATAGRTNR